MSKLTILSFLLCLVLSSFLRGQKIIQIEDLIVNDNIIFKGKNKYSGLAYGVKTEENRFLNPFSDFISIPYESRYPLEKLHGVDSINVYISNGKLMWVKAYIKQEPFAILKFNKDKKVFYGFYGEYRNNRKEVDTTVYRYEFNAQNDTLNGQAIGRDFNHGKDIYEKRDIYYFKNGKVDGIRLWYYPSNENGVQVLKQRGMSKSGKNHGTDSTWYENGMLESVHKFVDGKRQGYSLLYYRDGKSLRDSSIYENDEKIAYFKYTYNGMLYAKKVDGVTSNLRLTGEVIFENREGKLVYKTLHNAPYRAVGNGRTEIREYNGHLIEVWHFQNGRKHGEHIVYYPSGKVALKEEYINGKRTNASNQP